MNTGQQYNGRIDWTGTKDFIAGSTYVTYSRQLGGTADRRPNQDQLQVPTNADVTAIWTHTLSPTMLNEARGNFTRFGYNQLANSGTTNYGIPQVNVQFPAIAQIQYGANQGDTSPGVFAQNTYEFRDALSKVFGNHSLKFGFELRREQDNDNLAGGARQVYAMQNLWNFANDAPVYEGVEANPAVGGPPVTQHYFRTHVYAGYVQDDWKVTPTLTLNLGVRWEYFSPMTEKNGNLYDWFPGPGLGNLTDSTIQHVNQLYDSNKRNIGPRFGFAYGPKSWAVVRGGFGVMYNRPEDSLLALTRQDNPTSESFGFCCGSATSPFAGGTIVYGVGSSNSIYSYPFNPATATGINPLTNTPNGEAVQVYAVPKKFPTTYAYIYSLETDFTWAQNYVVTLGYQGSNDHRLLHIVDEKFLYPFSGAAATNFTDIFNVAPDANSNYAALNATISRRLTKGVQFQNNFRWAKSLDTVSYEGPGGGTNPTYPQDFQSEYGPSDFDVKYSDVASGLYELPFFRTQRGAVGKVLGGWRINTIFTFHTGFPWTPKTGEAQLTPGGEALSPTRPYAYLCGDGGSCALTGQSNSAFLRPNGNFPGGGANYFLYTYPTGLTTLPPGIGRNVFRGPWYKDVDFSVNKVVKFPNKLLGEAAQLDLRLNLFNAFNQQNFAPFNFGDVSTFVDNSQFGQPTQELAGRAVELQARFSF